MLARALLATLLGAIVLMIWGAVYWTVLPFGNYVMSGAEDEVALTEALDDTLPESGVYVVPWRGETTSGEHSRAADQIWAERHRRGPIAHVFYREDGAEPMAASVFLGGFVNMFTSTLIAVGVLVLGLPIWPRYGQRVLVVFLLGLFAAVTVELSAPIWFYHAWDYHAYQALYHVGGWLLVGLAIAGLVKPEPVTPGFEA
ncbi:MAG: hypothetical protein R3234_02735 [Thermoanaerobaculia bacterium]|nr:hypothetical protein [Thermoanaerobaculia bacterium]